MTSAAARYGSAGTELPIVEQCCLSTATTDSIVGNSEAHTHSGETLNQIQMPAILVHAWFSTEIAAST